MKPLDNSPTQIVHGTECVLHKGQAYSIAAWNKRYLDILNKHSLDMFKSLTNKELIKRIEGDIYA